MMAILKPLKKRHKPETVELLARTGNDMVKVRLATGTTFAVYRFRLFAADDYRRRLTPAELTVLPWQGKGRDPLDDQLHGARAQGALL